MTKSIGEDLAKTGVLANCVALIAFLASAARSFCTGAVFDLSGGRATY